MHETLGTTGSTDPTDSGVPRVICRFGNVDYNIACCLHYVHLMY